MNYTEVTEASLDYADREDTETVSRVDMFVKIVEARVNKKLKTQKMGSRSSQPCIEGKTLYSLPSDFAGMRDIKIVDNNGSSTTLHLATPEQLSAIGGYESAGEVELMPYPNFEGNCGIEWTCYDGQAGVGTTTIINGVATMSSLGSILLKEQISKPILSEEKSYTATINVLSIPAGDAGGTIRLGKSPISHEWVVGLNVITGITGDSIGNDQFLISVNFDIAAPDYLVVDSFSIKEEVSASLSDTSSLIVDDNLYAIIADQIQIYPAQSITSSLNIVYHKKVPNLNSTDSTNWLADDHPDCYVFGLLVEISAFNKDGDAKEAWDARFKEAMLDIHLDDSRSRWSGTPMQMKVV